MKIELWSIRKTSETYLLEGMKDYTKRITNYCQFTYKELEDKRLKGSLNPKQIKEIEADLVMKGLTKSDYLILLDEKGRQYSSEDFGKWISKLSGMGRKRYLFLIGGPYGFSERIYNRADARWSLSSLTFPHQLIRIFALEQIYRAFTIIKNQKYHH